MLRKDDTVDACINRMREFYHAGEIDAFAANLSLGGYDYNEGLKFLDLHTRWEYRMNDGKNVPDICDYLERYIMLKKMEVQ